VRQLEPALLVSSLFCTALADLLATQIGIPWCFLNPSFYFGDHGTQAWEDDFVGLGAGWFRYILLPHCERATVVLHATDRQFDPPPSDLPDHHHYIGPLFGEPPHDPASFLEEPGAPWALISLSTVPQDGELAIARAALRALKDKPVRTLLTLAQGHPRGELGTIPKNARVREFVPHGPVLDNGALVVSHAGHGIVMKGLYHGVPMVLVPWGRDQSGVARRAEALGVAVVVRREECSEERVAEAVDRVIGDERYARAATQVSQRMRTEDAANRACLHIEELIERA
jgi:MGT family glycosyltransferase